MVAWLWHGAWGWTIPVPIDWDPAYYLDVARSIARGDGAVSGAMWHLSGPDLPLPQPADLHWMPLPSRVLVPFVALLGDAGATVVTALLAAAWVPVAAGLAHHLHADRRGILGAASLAMLGGGYVRFLSTPDSIAVFGALAGLTWLAAAHGRVGAAVVGAALVALTRGDGFLLAPAVGLVFAGRGRWGAAVGVSCAGPLAFLAWSLRNLHLGGAPWLEARRHTSGALHIHDFLRGSGGSATALERVGAAVDGVQGALGAALVVGVVLLPVLAVAGGGLRRQRPLVWGLAAYAVLMPVVPSVLAPGVAASGSAFRSGAALFPAGCALAALATVALGDLGHRVRGYPRWLVPGLVGVGIAVGTVGLGHGTWSARPGPPVDCTPLEAALEAPVLTGRPLLVRVVCGPPAVVILRDESPADVAARARRHGAFRALLPEHDPDPVVPTRADAAALLPGWRERSPGLWVHPDAPSATAAPTGW